MAHDARLNKPDEDGKTPREHLRSLALRGRKDAQKQLDGKPIPEPLEYLYGWFLELVTMAEYGAYGDPRPFSAPLIDSWSRLMDCPLEPYEVRALAELSRVWAHPPPEEGD